MIKKPDLQAVAFKVQIYKVIWDSLPFSSDGKESAYNVEDVGLTPGLESSGGGHGNHSRILAHGQRSRATVYGVAESDTTNRLSTLTLSETLF